MSPPAASSSDNPDAWVERNPTQWRHGKWNAETPMNELEKHGFVTPSDLFFIRSHAAVPIKPSANIDNEHKVEICGQYTKKPMTFSLGELKSKFQNRELWSCLVCSGHRRLELNLIEKGAGHIDWHNASGNALWKGVYLRDVLNYCEVDVERAKHVEFVGADDYHTSIPFAKCIDVSGDTLLAWEMNGEPLLPDHGYPLRIVVPGWSSKCSSKWIKRISVQEKETEAHMYHNYYKWFPKHIKSATKQKDEVLATPPVTELNTNLVAFQPRNNAKVPANGNVKVSGYCFTGGGRPVSRIEVSVDDGESWMNCDIARQELTSKGRCYSWVMWEKEVNFDTKTHKDIQVRAFDISAQGMTKDHEWNLTGMMNNAYFKIKAQKFDGQMFFRHPTSWMSKDAKPPVTEALFKWNNDPNVLVGSWNIGDALAPLTLKLSKIGGEYWVQSIERIYGGQNFSGSIDGNKVTGTFGPFFTVTGEIVDGEIRWNNNARWVRIE